MHLEGNYPNGPIEKRQGHEKANYLILGQRQTSNDLFHRNGRARGRQPLAAWLPCSGVLNSIKVTLCHGTKSPQLPLVSMVIDRETSIYDTLEPSEIDQIAHPKKSFEPLSFSDDMPCQCSLTPEAFRQKELHRQPHYTTSDRNVGGQSTRDLRTWVTPDGILTGMQFVAEDGDESPRWGYCEAELPAELEAREVQWYHEPGLWFWLDSNESPSVRDDSVVVGIRPIRFVPIARKEEHGSRRTPMKEDRRTPFRPSRAAIEVS